MRIALVPDEAITPQLGGRRTVVPLAAVRRSKGATAPLPRLVQHDEPVVLHHAEGEISLIEVRTYMLGSVEALELYASVHWARHIPSLAAHGITTHHIWTEVGGDQPRLVAVVEYAADSDPQAVTKGYMASREFRDDMAGFPMDQIRGVTSVFMQPAPSAPGASAAG